MRSIVAIAACLLSSSAIAHQSPAGALPSTVTASELKLADAPASAVVRKGVSQAGTHGQVATWTAADGSRWRRETILLRGFKTDFDQRITINPDGTIETLEVRGVTPGGDAAERYSSTAGFVSPVDRGPPAPAGAFYVPFTGIPYDLIVSALQKAPGNRLRLHPSGEVRLVRLADTTVTSAGKTKQLTAYALEGLGSGPPVVWADGNEVFGTVGRLSFLPTGWESVAPALIKAEEDALAERGAALVDKIGPRPHGSLVFRNVRLFDAPARRFRDGMTVIVEAGRIAQVGSASAVRLPAGAQVIDGAGKTLLPGLWDAHSHFSRDTSGYALLSQGVTSVRDPGGRVDSVTALNARIKAGTLLGPRSVASMLIDGRCPLASSAAVPVGDEAEAVAAVRRARELGYAGVKLYGSLEPKLVAPIAREAHRLGLRVHGHIQKGRRPTEALADGYDEITHINWVMMQAMPQEVIDQSNGLQRFYGPYRYGPAVDFKAEPMNSFLDELARRKIVVDPTLQVFEEDFTPAGELSRSLSPFADLLPPVDSRQDRGPQLVATAEVPVAQIEKGFGKLKELVKELHDRGVPLVVGTDGRALAISRELELYVEAGISPADALAYATIVPANVFGVGRETGSIEQGKLAELVLVNGDPSKHMGDIRNVELVMRDSRLMKASDLRLAAGLAR